MPGKQIFQLFDKAKRSEQLNKNYLRNKISLTLYQALSVNFVYLLLSFIVIQPVPLENMEMVVLVAAVAIVKSMAIIVIIWTVGVLMVVRLVGKEVFVVKVSYTFCYVELYFSFLL